jgi:uncharacterized protein YecT (DUF1311 family)
VISFFWINISPVEAKLMQPLEPLHQLTVDAFAAALETCRDEGIDLPEEVWAIAQSLEQHVDALSEIAKQHAELNAAYQTAQKLLRQVKGVETAVQPIVYRYVLPDNALPQTAIAFSKQVEAIRQSNPDWIVTFDRPNPGEADAIVLIRKDEHYAATHAAYLANRTLNQVVGPALNRIFGHASFNFPMSS